MNRNLKLIFETEVNCSTSQLIVKNFTAEKINLLVPVDFKTLGEIKEIIFLTKIGNNWRKYKTSKLSFEKTDKQDQIYFFFNQVDFLSFKESISMVGYL